MVAPWQAYFIDVYPTCKDKTKSNEDSQVQAVSSGRREHLSVIRFITPWSSDTTHGFVGRNTTNR